MHDRAIRLSLCRKGAFLEYLIGPTRNQSADDLAEQHSLREN
jgi:hypothetical protein